MYGLEALLKNANFIKKSLINIEICEWISLYIETVYICIKMVEQRISNSKVFKYKIIESEEGIMIAVNLVDLVDKNTYYGTLLCENNCISEEILQEKIYEIKDKFESEDYDWMIEDIIDCFPKEWNVHLQEKYIVLAI